MGCGASKAVFTAEKTDDGGPPVEVPKAVAFEIPANPEEEKKEGESIVKKHLPKRLQRLEEQASVTLTAEEIAEKAKEAEERRKELLEEKIQKAKNSQGKVGGNNGTENSSKKSSVS